MRTTILFLLVSLLAQSLATANHPPLPSKAAQCADRPDNDSEVFVSHSPRRGECVKIWAGKVVFFDADGKSLAVPLEEVMPRLAQVVWSPDGGYFAINASDGGAVGTWEVSVFRVDRARQIAALPVQSMVLADAAKLPQCEDPETPNVSALEWETEGHVLRVVAQSPPHSSCRNMGALRGYRIGLEPLKLISMESEQALRAQWGNAVSQRYPRNR
jgi:hypothetical protein